MRLSFSIACLGFALVVSLSAQVRGGSNYENFVPLQAEFTFNTFSLCLSKDRHFETPNGPAIYSIFHYDVAKDSIDAELQAMFDQGQRRLRIPIVFLKAGDGYSCQYLTTPGGVMPNRFRNNLTNLLATIRRIGFEEIIVSYFPLGPNFPNNWTSWQEDIYQDNWNLIQNTRPIVAAAGIPYLLDLGNEHIAAPTQQPGQIQLLAYTQRLWTDYTAKFGKDDTLGFAIIANTNQFRADTLPSIYGNNPQSSFDLHIYDSPLDTFLYEKQRLDQLGYGDVDWIIGETYADAASIAPQLRSGMQSTGKSVRWVAQWPITPTTTWVMPTILFTNYIAFGF